MATTYAGKIDEQDQYRMFPAVDTNPGFFDRMAAGIKMDFPNAGMRDSRQPYPMTESGAGTGTLPMSSGMPVVRNAADVLPPLPVKNQGSGRDYLAEIEAKSKNTFNAERDTPQPTAAQAAYVPPMTATRTNPWDPEILRNHEPDLGVMTGLRQGAEAGRSGYMPALQQYEKELAAQVHTMLPGASPKDIRAVMTTISQATKNPTSMSPTQPANAGGPVTNVSQAIDKTSQGAAPNYQKLGAGQSMYQMLPDGTAKLVTTAPGGAAEGRKNDQFKDMQKNSVGMYEKVMGDYRKNWDKITQDVPDGPQRESALRNLNVQHFSSMGVPAEIAAIPESFKSYLHDKSTQVGPDGVSKALAISREQTEAYAQEHKRLMKIRHQLLNRFWNNTLQFGGPGGTR